MISTNEFKSIASLDLDPIKMKLMHKESGEGWSLEKVNAVEVEYRRFLCLMKKFPNEDTAPQVEVDVFWHYHILDTMKYAKDCEQAFGYFLHHYPYIGLRGEDDVAVQQRAGERMRELYEATFGASAGSPDGQAWCGAAVQTAWCGAAVDTAWCGAAKEAAQGGVPATAWCGAAKELSSGAATAWCGAAKEVSTGSATAWCGVARKLSSGTATAWCGAAKELPSGSATAWCGAAKELPSGSATAWCGAARKLPSNVATAWCGAAKELSPGAATAWCGVASKEKAEEALAA
jgi:hypothetical protein